MVGPIDSIFEPGVPVGDQKIAGDSDNTFEPKDAELNVIMGRFPDEKKAPVVDRSGRTESESNHEESGGSRIPAYESAENSNTDEQGNNVALDGLKKLANDFKSGSDGQPFGTTQENTGGSPENNRDDNGYEPTETDDFIKNLLGKKSDDGTSETGNSDQFGETNKNAQGNFIQQVREKNQNDLRELETYARENNVSVDFLKTQMKGVKISDVAGYVLNKLNSASPGGSRSVHDTKIQLDPNTGQPLKKEQVSISNYSELHKKPKRPAGSFDFSEPNI